MMVLLIILASLLMYAMIGRKLLPLFTEFQVQRIYHRYPQQTHLDTSDQGDVLLFSAVQSLIWPLALTYTACWKASGVLGDPNGERLTEHERKQRVIDQRLAKRQSRQEKTNAQLLAENKKMAEKLGLPTDEYP